jgi:hypothetical protein
MGDIGSNIQTAFAPLAHGRRAGGHFTSCCHPIHLFRDLDHDNDDGGGELLLSLQGGALS